MAVVGVGVDAVDVPRLRKVIGRTPGVERRLFSEAERAYAARFRDPAKRLAALFAAKEAAMKALGVGLGAFKLTDVEVVRRRTGAPEIALAGSAALLADQVGVERWHLSLTHSDTVAVAVVIAEA